mmetsp:Transcript_29571/g.71164  ORF Transcript_29571/g.71164 Transcript_29571/m.71164 type:complete len:616 (+) Transcript_29571:108-1955(+)
MTDDPELNDSTAVVDDGQQEKGPTESEDQDEIDGYSGGNAEQETPPVQSFTTNESDKDIKAREKNLKLAEAVAPPPPSMSSLTSSNRQNKEYEKSSITSSIKSNSDDVKNSKRAAAANGASLTSSINSNNTGSQQQERSPLRYSTNHHAAKHAKAARNNNNNTRQIAAGPGAVRMTTTTTSANSSVDDNDQEAQVPEAVPLTAETVDDTEEQDRIQKLQQDNEALRKQVELALQSEKRALEEMQTMAHAPPAAVSMATSVVSTEEPTPAPESSRSHSTTITAEQTQKCCWNLCQGTVFVAGCCCIFCVIIGVVVVFAVGLDNILVDVTNSAGDEVEAATRRSNLETLLLQQQGLEPPLHEQAFQWLVDTDQWQPDDLLNNNNATEPPTSDQGVVLDSIENLVGNLANANEGSTTVGTGERKWMFIERYYLAVLYFSTRGDNWTQNFGWMSETTSHCAEGAKQWFGIQCENDSIVSIELETNNLDGSFPTEIQVLSNLRSIWMGDDIALTGTIPTMPGNLTRIWIWNMRLSGNLPEHLFELSGLTSLRLYQNELTGAIPSNIIQLSDLQTLELVGNQLTGTVPVLPNVTSCDLSSNKFTDTVNGAAQGCVVFDQNP